MLKLNKFFAVAIALLALSPYVGAQTRLELWSNNGSSTLSTGINDSTTTIPVASGHGSRFPSPTGGQYFWLTIQAGTTIEIVKCTARSTDSLTCTRAQQGTSASSFSSGARVENRLTRDTLANIRDVLGPPTTLTIDGLEADGNADDSEAFTEGVVLQNTTDASGGTPIQESPALALVGSAYTDDATNDPDNTHDGLHDQKIVINYTPTASVNVITDEPAGILRWRYCFTVSAVYQCRTPMWMLSQGNLLMHSSIDVGMGGRGDVSTSGNGAFYFRGCDSGGGADTGTSTVAHCADFLNGSTVMTRAMLSSSRPGRLQIYGSSLGTPKGVELVPGVSGESITASSCGTSPTVDAAARPSAGYVTVGSGTVHSCQIDFPSGSFTNAPMCMVNNHSNTEHARAVVASNVALVITGDGTNSINGNIVYWICIGRV